MILIWKGNGIIVPAVFIGALFFEFEYAQLMQKDSGLRSFYVFLLAAITLVPLDLLTKKIFQILAIKLNITDIHNIRHSFFFIPTQAWPYLLLLIGIFTYFAANEPLHTPIEFP